MGYGIDRTPVKVTPGEAILPVKTTRALGTANIRQLIQQTTGKSPKIGVRRGGKYADGSDGDIPEQPQYEKDLAFSPNPANARPTDTMPSGRLVNSPVVTPPPAAAAPATPVQEAKAAINPVLASPTGEAAATQAPKGFGVTPPASASDNPGTHPGIGGMPVFNDKYAQTQSGNTGKPMSAADLDQAQTGIPSIPAAPLASKNNNPTLESLEFTGKELPPTNLVMGKDIAENTAGSSINGKPLVAINSNPNVTMSSIDNSGALNAAARLPVTGGDNGSGGGGPSVVTIPNEMYGNMPASLYGMGPNANPVQAGIEAENKGYGAMIDRMRDASRFNGNLPWAAIEKGQEANFGAMPETAQQNALQRQAELGKTGMIEEGANARNAATIAAEAPLRSAQATESEQKASEQQQIRTLQQEMSAPGTSKERQAQIAETIGKLRGIGDVYKPMSTVDVNGNPTALYNQYTGEKKGAADSQHPPEAVAIKQQLQDGKITRDEAIKQLKALGYQD